MAIVKFNNRKGSTTVRRQKNLKRILEYITDSKKTCGILIGGQGVSRENALERMNTVKKYYGKEGGREYIHFSVSFRGNQDSETVYQIAQIISCLFVGYQVLFAVHINTQNTHIHFVINSVSIQDGHKYSQSRYDMQQLKDKIESIVVRYGLSADDMTFDDNDLYNEDDDYDYYYEEYEETTPIGTADYLGGQNCTTNSLTNTSVPLMPIPHGLDFIYATQMATIVSAITNMQEKE